MLVIDSTTIQSVDYILGFYHINNKNKVIKIKQIIREKIIQGYAQGNAEIIDESLTELYNEIKQFHANKPSYSPESNTNMKQILCGVIRECFAASPTEGGLGFQLPAKQSQKL